jgi:hypothetical protein
MLDITFVGGAVILVSLPVSLRWCFDSFVWANRENYNFLLLFLFITGLLCLAIIYELRIMLVTLNDRDPFRRENVASLKNIAVLALLISLAYVVKIIFYISFLTIIVSMVFLIIGLFSLILSEIFRQAVEVKEENDLTV